MDFYSLAMALNCVIAPFKPLHSISCDVFTIVLKCIVYIHFFCYLPKFIYNGKCTYHSGFASFSPCVFYTNFPLRNDKPNTTTAAAASKF